MIRLAITFDHQLVVEGLLSTLRDEPDMAVSAVFESCAELTRGLPEAAAGIALLDLQLAERHDIGFIRTLAGSYRELRIILLGNSENAAYIAGLMQQGCRGYLLKRNAGREQLTRAIREVAAGGIFLEAALKEQLLHEMLTGRRRRSRISTLVTQREREVLQLILDEHSNQEIAERLYISPRTVETHRYNLQQKLNVRNTAGLVRVARQMGMG